MRVCIDGCALSVVNDSILMLSVFLARAAAACSSSQLGELTGLAYEVSSCLAPCPSLSLPQAAVACIADIQAEK